MSLSSISHAFAPFVPSSFVVSWVSSISRSRPRQPTRVRGQGGGSPRSSIWLQLLDKRLGISQRSFRSGSTTA
ncbi:hypothetical protein BDZ91DRAFT_64915 [Kalaharituber pfeilii]|nr:hypothetical protein BDZ91DRAFT_64915 [Kalaharituber pfeilii]